ncbi:MAG: cupin domain-containing protein, partial [Asgard group archaeon]|nr:cupin domain-containing protein [Asgard group archaeon]
DPNFHSHSISLEIYLLIEGELWHVVDEVPIIMKGRSLLLVQPGISHSIIGGKGKIQHFGLKIPHQKDEKIIDSKTRAIGKILDMMKKGEVENNLDPSIGFFIDLNNKKNQNTWQVGIGHALYYTEEFCLTYVNFPTEEEQRANDHKDVCHYHKQSTEWYLTIRGERKLLIDDEVIICKANTLLRVNAGTPHNIISRKYPFEGVTIKTPVVEGDKYVLEEK